jgi:hypothetical protein
MKRGPPVHPVQLVVRLFILFLSFRFLFHRLITTMRIPHSIFSLSPLLVFLPSSHAHSDSGGALYPPALQPLINRANTLLSLGQFNEAVTTYSEAIGALFPSVV